MTTSTRRRRPQSRSSVATLALTFAGCRSGCCIPAVDAWTSARSTFVNLPSMLPPLATTNVMRCHRARCRRPRREWVSTRHTGPRDPSEEGKGIGPDRIGLFGHLNTKGSLGNTAGPRGQAIWRSLWSRGSETDTAVVATTTAHPWGRRRFWRRLMAGLVAVTVLSWLSPRVAAAVSTVVGSAAEGVAGAATAETASAVAGTAVADAPSAATAAVPPAAQQLIRPLGTLQVLPTRAELELSVRLLFAALGGAAVGLERSSSDRPAGVRTMALVSLGAAAFTLCSMYGFMSVGALVGPDGPTTKYDPSRMASNVASGVGFIGAGVITNNRKAAGVYDRQSTVGGLTTAAAIWASAAIGVANGVGLYFIGASAAASTILILRFGHLKHSHFWGGGRDVTVGSKKKKKGVVDGDVGVDGAGMVNATATMDMANTTVASKPSAALAGDEISQPRHGAIDARLEEMAEQEDTAEVVKASFGDSESSAKPTQHELDEMVRLSDHSVKIKKVGGSESASTAGDTIVEIQSPPKERKKEAESPPFIDSPPLPPPSSADPLLEKYLWGVDSFSTDGEDDRSSSGESSRSRLSIEEDQEVVYRHGRIGDSNCEGKEGSP